MWICKPRGVDGQPRRTRLVSSLPLLLAALLTASALPLTTPGHADVIEDILFTEIMYNPASGDRREDFLEIYNKSPTETYNLEGFFFTSGVEFVFPNVDIGPGEYLVVAANPTRAQQVYGIPAERVVGPWSSFSTLDNGGEKIRLVNQFGIEVEDVTFDDRNPWPILADGFGHSLERRHPELSNDGPNNWGASQVGTGWTLVQVTGIATSDRLYMYLTDAGVAYVDDVRIYPLGNPGNNRVANGGFESGNTSWATTGNHAGSSWTTEKAHSGSRSMKLVASAGGGSSGNSLNQEGMGLVVGQQYTLEFWVLFESIGQTMIGRLSGSGGEIDPIEVETGGGGATPGRQNSIWTDDIPPFVFPVVLLPNSPDRLDDVTIIARVTDDNTVSTVTLHWDAGSGEQTMAMLDDGNHGDDLPGDGVYGAEIGRFSTGTIVNYWVTAVDNAGQPGRFPFPGNPTPSLGFYIQPTNINPAFQPRSNSGLISSRPAVYHLLINTGDLNGGHLRDPLNVYRRATFIYDGEVFENIRVRHRGQSSLGVSKKHWKVDFNKDHRFLTPFGDHPEVDNINLQSAYGDKSFLREWLGYKAFMDVERPGLEMWHIRLYLNGVYRGLYVHLENPNADWLDREAKMDDEGWMWKSYSQARGGTGGFEIKADADNPAAANAALGSFTSQMNNLSGASLVNYIQNNMDVDAFIDFLALHQLMHNADHPAPPKTSSRTSTSASASRPVPAPTAWCSS